MQSSIAPEMISSDDKTNFLRHFYIDNSNAIQMIPLCPDIAIPHFFFSFKPGSVFVLKCAFQVGDERSQLADCVEPALYRFNGFNI